MHLQPLTLLAAVVVNTAVSVVAAPAPSLVASAQKHDATLRPRALLNTTGFTATLMYSAEESSCWLEIDLPSMGCSDRTEKIMEYGHARPDLPEACWRQQRHQNEFFVKTKGFCGSALLLVSSEGRVSVQNKEHEAANFYFTTIRYGDVFTAAPGPISLRS